MRVAIDARELRGQPTGVGRYLASLLTAWAELPSARSHEFVLCAPGPIDPAVAGTASVLVRRGWQAIAGTIWEQLTLPAMVREAKADVLFAPGYTGPLLSPVPMVVAIHDVSFAAHPEWFRRREGLRRRALAHLSAHRAARVLTISEFSKREIVQRLGIPEELIEVVYLGAPAPVPGADRAHAQDNGRQHLVLFVGSLFDRRHVPELIDAFGRLARQRGNVRLEIVGDNRMTPRVDFDQLIGATGASDRIALRSYVPDAILRDLYARARVFVFLSEYEGFGLTPLEALANGIPVVMLDTPVAREVYGDAAIYVPQPDPAPVRDAIERALFDDAERSRVLDAARRLLPRYSWRACAERVLGVMVDSSTRPGS